MSRIVDISGTAMTIHSESADTLASPINSPKVELVTLSTSVETDKPKEVIPAP